MQLGLDDVDRAGARVGLALQVDLADRHRDHGVEDALGDLAAVAPQHRRIRHQVPDVAHEQQRATVQHDLAPVRAAVAAVFIEAARERLAALGDFLGQRALQDAEPVRIGEHLVLGVDDRDRILQVEDRRQRGFEVDVGDAGRVRLADRRVAVDADVDMDAVVDEQHRRRCRRVALVADELLGAREARRAAALERDDERAAFDAVARRIAVRRAGQRRRLVEEAARVVDDALAAHRVVALALLGAAGLGDRVGAVERVVQRAPARIGGVERIARVEDRHDELRSGLHGELGVDVGRRDLHALGVRLQVADRFEEAAVRHHVGDRPRVLAMPGVDLGLQPVALGEQRDVLRREVVNQRVEALPEIGARQAGDRQHPVFDEAVQLGGDLQAMAGGACGHGRSLNYENVDDEPYSIRRR